MTDTPADAARPAPQPARALPELLRELADAADATGRVSVSAEFLDALADRVAELEAENARIRKASKLLPGILDDYAATVDAAGQAIANGRPVTISFGNAILSAASIAAHIRKLAADLRAALAR
jgi:hypothetical protein